LQTFFDYPISPPVDGNPSFSSPIELSLHDNPFNLSLHFIIFPLKDFSKASGPREFAFLFFLLLPPPYQMNNIFFFQELDFSMKCWGLFLNTLSDRLSQSYFFPPVFCPNTSFYILFKWWLGGAVFVIEVRLKTPPQAILFVYTPPPLCPLLLFSGRFSVPPPYCIQTPFFVWLVFCPSAILSLGTSP